MRLVLNRLLASVITEADRPELRRIDSRLHELLNVRNKVLHSGRLAIPISPDDFERFLKPTRALLGSSAE